MACGSAGVRGHCEPPQAAKQSPRRRAGMRGQCTTSAAGRSNLPHPLILPRPWERGNRRRARGRPHVGVPVFAVIARPAQPVEAISLTPCPSPARGRGEFTNGRLRDPTRSPMIPKPARGSGATGAVRASVLRWGVPGCAVIASPPQAAKQSPRRRVGMRGHGATSAAGRSNLITAPPAQPVEAISSRRHRRSRSKQSHHGATSAAGRSNLPHPLPLSRARARKTGAVLADVPMWECRCSLGCSVRP
ncbi:MAG: hypothetical protein KatS3mg058_4695 [Roseiflexus sp.]|nr:MAG: hypothetical protein KatS3mg058_4695 [Roseiflexus sp.]